LPRGNESQDFRFRSLLIIGAVFYTAGSFRKRYDRHGITVSVRYIQRFPVLAERQGFGTRAGQGILREPPVDSFNLLIEARIDHRDAVGV